MALMSSFLQGGEVFMALMSSNELLLAGGEVFMALMSSSCRVGMSSWL